MLKLFMIETYFQFSIIKQILFSYVFLLLRQKFNKRFRIFELYLHSKFQFVQHLQISNIMMTPSYGRNIVLYLNN